MKFLSAPSHARQQARASSCSTGSPFARAKDSVAAVSSFIGDEVSHSAESYLLSGSRSSLLLEENVSQQLVEREYSLKRFQRERSSDRLFGQ